MPILLKIVINITNERHFIIHNSREQLNWPGTKPRILRHKRKEKKYRNYMNELKVIELLI